MVRHPTFHLTAQVRSPVAFMHVQAIFLQLQSSFTLKKKAKCCDIFKMSDNCDVKLCHTIMYYKSQTNIFC